MTDWTGALALGRRAGLPDALRALRDAYPHADQHQHANFGGMIGFWKQRHALFRKVTAQLRMDAGNATEKRMAPAENAQRLTRWDDVLFSELHTHHHFGDTRYFPKLITLDARLHRGFNHPQPDQAAMDGMLQAVSEGADTVLQGGPVDAFRNTVTGFASPLERHFCDEDGIVVPVELKTGFEGGPSRRARRPYPLHALDHRDFGQAVVAITGIGDFDGLTGHQIGGDDIGIRNGEHGLVFENNHVFDAVKGKNGASYLIGEGGGGEEQNGGDERQAHDGLHVDDAS
jgi:hypothetical protein